MPGPKVAPIVPELRPPPVRRARTVRSKEQEKQERAEVPPPQPPVRMPELGPVISVQERQEHQQRLEQILARTLNLLRAAERKPMTASQQTVKARVEAFIQQAQVFSKTDLRTARNLAERAELLARDLAKSLGIP